jgi:hypothetical protein
MGWPPTRIPAEGTIIASQSALARPIRLSSVVFAIIVVMRDERWWRDLGRQRYSAIELRINGVPFEEVAEIDYGR